MMNIPTGISYSLMAATALCAVAACSHSDDPDLSARSLIAYEAEASSFARLSRAADVTTTENSPEFRIWAYDYDL